MLSDTASRVAVHKLIIKLYCNMHLPHDKLHFPLITFSCHGDCETMSYYVLYLRFYALLVAATSDVGRMGY